MTAHIYVDAWLALAAIVSLLIVASVLAGWVRRDERSEFERDLLIETDAKRHPAGHETGALR